jgi:uncharacterized repeat protein (TIGR03803 family)
MRRLKLCVVIATVIVFASTVVATPSIEAQTFNVIHSFTGGQDGAFPRTGLTIDRSGNLYGTTFTGGAANGYGAVYKLAHQGSDWVLTPLYDFQGGSDGAYPYASVIFGSDGSLYGTTAFGGDGTMGTVFRLKPQVTTCRTGLCPWNETVLFSFDGSNGNQPVGEIVFDAAGSLYGTTSYAGYGSGGTVYKLSPRSGGWTLAILHSFSSNDGNEPFGGVIFDKAGNLYGTTAFGPGNACNGGGCGIVFQLVPSESGWTENILYAFQNGGAGELPRAGLIFDSLGNLYGTTAAGQGRDGTYPIVFELTPSNGIWTFSVLHEFSGNQGPQGSLAMDSAGNLYGTTYAGGAHGYGSLFKLTPMNGGWTYADLHGFTGDSDGGYPYSNVTLDAYGNFYGTASIGGANDYGVVWEVTP